MLVAVPADESGARFDHFGFCDHFAIVSIDIEPSGKENVLVVSAVPNTVKGPRGGEARVDAFQELGVSAVVTDHMGAPMFERLTAAQIPVYLEHDLLSPEEAALQAAKGSLRKMTENDL